MSDNISVTLDTSKDNVPPSLEEEAAKYETADSSVEERPEWLPEKFKSPAELAKAYSELEKKLGSRSAPVETASTEEPSDDTPVPADDAPEGGTAGEKAAREATEKAGLNFDELASKYWEKGELDPADYDTLEKTGIPKAVVDQFIAGQQALLNATRQTVFSQVGGEAVYTEMTEWAADTMTKAEIDAFNKAVNSGDMNMTMMAVKGLEARYKAEVGFEPRRQVKGENTTATASVYRSLAELQKDMSDPRYQKDPAFRKDVENKLARSDIM